MGDALSSLLFQPPRPTPIKESKLVWLHTKLGSKIPAFFMERPGATITFLYSHANAEDLGTVYPWVKFLAKSLDVNVLAYDYTGYGLSQPNEPSEENCFADIDAAYEYLTTVRRISPANIVLYGRSLGSGPSCYLASRTADEGKSVAGLILHAPFLSVFRVVFESGCTLIGDKFQMLILHLEYGAQFLSFTALQIELCLFGTGKNCYKRYHHAAERVRCLLTAWDIIM